MTSAETSSKVRMNSVPMILRLASGSTTPASLVRNFSDASTVTETDAGGGHVVALHLLALTLAQQPVVDEDARELVADGTVHEGRGDRGVDAARQTAEHVVVADALADLGDRRRR